jgi:hypothetical protein
MNVFAVRREGLKNAVSLAYSFALAADDDGEWREGGGEIRRLFQREKSKKGYEFEFITGTELRN